LDLQRDFLEADGRMSVGVKNGARVITTANRLLRHARGAGWKEIFIKNEFPRADQIGNLFRNGAAIQGSVGAEIDPRIHLPADGLVLSRSKSDAFTNPVLAAVLGSLRIRHLVIL